MANLDIALERDSGSPLEQSVLMTTDGLDASGFLEHLKLPHYVTFRSMMERKAAMRSAKAATSTAKAATNTANATTSTAGEQQRSDCEVTEPADGWSILGALS